MVSVVVLDDDETGGATDIARDGDEQKERETRRESEGERQGEKRIGGMKRLRDSHKNLDSNSGDVCVSDCVGSRAKHMATIA